jgi:hypothetical protein
MLLSEAKITNVFEFNILSKTFKRIVADSGILQKDSRAEASGLSQ